MTIDSWEISVRRQPLIPPCLGWSAWACRRDGDVVRIIQREGRTPEEAFEALAARLDQEAT